MAEEVLVEDSRRVLLTHLGAVGVGAGLTLALAVMAGPGAALPAEAREVSSPAPTEPVVVVERAAPGVSPAALERAEAELSICELDRRLMSARLQTYEGEFQDWPDRVEHRFEPDAVEEALQRTVDGSGLAELTFLDCDEFPCVAVLESVDPEEPCCVRLQRILRDMHGYEDISRPSISGVVDGRPVMVVAIQPPGEDGEVIGTRTGWRLNELYESLQVAAGEL